ncbi:phasin family protein [Pseudomonas sp. DrBHI1]|uniref:phasin family protein n=1 Tax=Pseudomonas sp. DrBHI1 TaxID=2006091 RepID=UPI000B58D7E6|nr:phasin family protein [Pseudomonas sp. DrBHI1]OWQ36899.1 poly(hydroxyalkanoate) granule-associated protein [Pseudomonas sp. DrBHI1]
MAGKKNTEKEGSSWIGGIEKYSRKIWLAGLGIYSKIDQDGPKLFDSLVKDGEKAEKQAKKTAEDVAESAKSSTNSRVSGVKDRALGKWSELEEAFDKRLNSAISRLGVPSRNEIKALHQQVDSLTKQIEKLTGASVTPISKASASKTAAKPLAKAAAKPAAKTAAAKPAAKPAAKTAAAKPAAKPAAAKPTAAKKPAVKKATPTKPAAAKPAAPAPAATAAPAPSAAPASSTPSAPVNAATQA